MLPTSGLQPRLPQPSGHVLADGSCHPASVSSAGPGMRRVSVVIGDGACGDWRMVLWRSGVSHGALRRQCRFAIAHERACPIPGPCSRRPMACRRSVAWCPQLCDALSHVIPCVDPITDSVRCPRTGAGWWLPAPAVPAGRATIRRCCVPRVLPDHVVKPLPPPAPRFWSEALGWSVARVGLLRMCNFFGGGCTFSSG